MADEMKGNYENKHGRVPALQCRHYLPMVKLGYHYLVSNSIYLCLIPLNVMLLTHFSTVSAILSTDSVENFTELRNQAWFNILSVVLCLISVYAVALYFMARPRKVYLVDFACYKPEPSHKFSRERLMLIYKACGCFTEESLSFMQKIMEKSGYGPMTYGPKSYFRVPPDRSLAAQLEETDMVMFGAIDELLAKTGVNPRDIGILVVNSCMFNPTPSLSARIVNRYKLKQNILSYNLGGMGCSAGLISIDLAKRLLQVLPNSYALVVSSENITGHLYSGNVRSMLLTNCLFRVGSAAILLSSKFSDRRRSKYRLVHTVRTHKGADDECFNCVIQKEDEAQRRGVFLSKDLITVAGGAIKTNITTLGPLVLPISEQLLFIACFVGKKVFKMKLKPYIPDFKLAFEHFCVHAGGRGVLDAVQKKLQLTEWHMEPSRMTLYRFGNTSSSSIWYELAYSEAKGRIKKGDRIWQIGLGSGFKCNSAVWQAMRTVKPCEEKNPWMDEIYEFPVHVPKASPLIY